MPKFCTAFNCSSNREKNPDLMFHTFSDPIKDEERHQKRMEKIFSYTWSDKHSENENVKSNVEPNAQNVIKDGEGLKRKNPVDTALLIHFFGKKGGTTLKREDFRRFMENLQIEVLEMEF